MLASGLGLVALALVSFMLIGIILAALIVVAMDEPVPDEVTYVNDTSRVLRLYDGENRYIADLEPYGSKTVGEYEGFWTARVIARTGGGVVAFRIDLTWDELKAQGYRIVFTEEVSPASNASPARLGRAATPVAPG